MKSQTKHLQVRDVPINQLEKLKLLARKNKFLSISEYLRYIFDQLTSEEDVVKTEIRFQELLNQQTELLKLGIQIIEKNNQLFERILNEME